MLNRQVVRLSMSEWGSASLRPTGPYWLQLVWTALFCLLMTAAVTVALVLAQGHYDRLTWSYVQRTFSANLVMSLTIGYLIEALFAIVTASMGSARVARLSRRASTALFCTVVCCGLLMGWPLGYWLAMGDLSSLLESPLVLSASILLTALLTVILLLWFSHRGYKQEVERRATEAQLKLLQAQMEPHFLFNTLANVLSLMEADPPRARHMLETFVDYLRASLGRLRRTGHTLGHELDTVQAYLQLLQIRMGDRLRYAIDVPAELLDASLPPLLLQPLVENAVHHGLEPSTEGGTVSVRAWLEGGQLHLSVCDDGIGLGAPASRLPRPGAGSALDNIRARLDGLFGHRAALHLQPGPRGCGVLASLQLPYATTAPAA